MIVVTGATGHVGSALLRALVERRAAAPTEAGGAAPETIRALVRPGRDLSCLAGLDVEITRGHLHDLDSLIAAFRGADAVFHLAGKVSITHEKLESLRHVNVEGTKNVIAACRAAGVRRLVYTSSIHAFTEQAQGMCTDEATPIDPEGVMGPYGKTKAEATRLAFAADGEELEVVVVFPTGIVGPYDCRPSEMGQMIIDFARHKIPASTDGGYNFVDVRDVAQALIAALERGRSGQGYLLCGSGITVPEMFGMLQEITGARAPRVHVNLRLLRVVAPLIPAYYWLIRQRPLFTSYSLHVLSSNYTVSCDKAQRELGFSPRPLRETFEDAFRWFRKQGMV